ncbi:biotin transporter BioY [Microvirga sp. W0021]|uniref:Biotin transporter n=1 Tax=Hohaiivirga grylli TaxID=3133970 RepID=A0ABV0BH19_9HYPH
MKWTFTTGDFVRIALFAAIIAALGVLPLWVSPPFLGGVPISIQSLGVMLAGVVIGARLGFFSVLLLMFVVLLGAPVLSGGRGGLGVLYGPTAGFFIGWLPAVLTVGWLNRVLPVTNAMVRAIIASIVGGIIVLYMCGIPMMSWRTGLSFDKTFFAMLAFIPLDVVKAVAVGYIAQTLQRWETPKDEEV